MRPVTNSEITCFQTCQRKWQHAYLERRTGFERPEALDRGTRIHAALATCRSAYEDARYGPAYAVLESLPLVERTMMRGYNTYNGGLGEPGIKDLRVNVPFIVRLGHVDLVGEVDALCIDIQSGRTVIIEDKTTTSDITPGTAWWREKIACDTQPTVYSAAFPGAYVMYNVLHVPDTEPLKATPVEKRKYTQPSKKEPQSRLYAGQRDRDETDDEYMKRVLADMAERPEHYFQRGVIVRLERDIEEYTEDLRQISSAMIAAMHEPGSSPRTPKACHNYGRPCEFVDACWNGKDIGSYPRLERNHSEDVIRRLETYKETA